MSVEDNLKSLDRKLWKLGIYYEVVYKTLNLAQLQIICNIMYKLNDVIRDFYLGHITDAGFMVFRAEKYDERSFKELIDEIEKENPKREKVKGVQQCSQCHFDGNRWGKNESFGSKEIEFYTCNYCGFQWFIEKKH